MHFGQRWIFLFLLPEGWSIPGGFFYYFLEILQILPMGNVRHFRIIHKNDAIFLKMHVFRENIVNSLEHLQILPMGNVRHFRRIHENDTLFLKMCVFRWNLVNSLETLQILPMGNVRHFRIIRKNDDLFLKMSEHVCFLLKFNEFVSD